MISPTNHITSLPYDPTCTFLSYLTVKDLGRATQVCRQWADCASNDNLWKDLCLRIFSIAVPKSMSGKEVICRYGGPAIKNVRELLGKYTSFSCDLVLNKKREFVCLSENKNADGFPILFIITQGVGPNYGTEKGFSGPSDEIEIYKIPDNIEKFYFIADSHFRQIGSTNTNIRSNLNGVNICANISITENLIYKQFSNASYSVIDLKSSQIKFKDGIFDEIVIETIDVGFGNTLGYCSSINNWKKPFKFSYSVDGKWSGRVPSQIYFAYANDPFELKFVKINAKGEITWETCENRNCNISNYLIERGIWRTYMNHPDIVNECWNQYLKDFPINFPKNEG